LYGDVPLVAPKTLEKLLKIAQKKSLALLTMELDNPLGYGRILRSANRQILGIKEEKDASSDQRRIKEVNSGIMALNSNLLKTLIPKIKNNNSSKEYYLTDLVEIVKNFGGNIKSVQTTFEEETLGANNPEELHHLERVYQKREALRLIKKGVRFGDINRFDIRGTLNAGVGCFVDVNCVFEGNVVLGRNTNIGPNCYIRNSIIEEGTKILANSVIEDSSIGKDSLLGPFTRVRGGSEIKDQVDLGNFVEVNRSNISPNSKVKHLSYLGDANIGDRVNIGAGTITCNYDGEKKSSTIIEDDAFIGSNTSLVAPVKVGKRAYTGAGSVITKNVPKENLAIGRGKQINLDKKK
jgi:bifunctional UDP-N-acetylglucosamine pyrophosphorylase/glucosamine-1-phosphate N-acetyltransferase